MMDASVRKANPLVAGMWPEPDRWHASVGCVRIGHTVPLTGIEGQSASPGVEPSTYSIESPPWEHGNLEPSAGSAKPGKPPSLVMSRSRGGAFVVVRARESRVQGEGRQ